MTLNELIYWEPPETDEYPASPCLRVGNDGTVRLGSVEAQTYEKNSPNERAVLLALSLSFNLPNLPVVSHEDAGIAASFRTAQ